MQVWNKREADDDDDEEDEISFSDYDTRSWKVLTFLYCTLDGPQTQKRLRLLLMYPALSITDSQVTLNNNKKQS